ncbi:MAG: superoxide dismutase [Patescibacteria group bacterium]|jgi:Fe-Mn family superoxide dismutase|nr:superoxide dismutase [bacterium]HQC49522.1 superoxide dismutase [bacterium]
MFQLNPLPFAKNALEPYISEKTVEFHYDKHHQTYVDNLNKLINETELAKQDLESIIIKTKNNPNQAAIFNNAAQVFNHDFFWQSLTPNSEEQKISDSMLALINKSFGSLDNFWAELKTAALAQFGSGWVWLVEDEGALKIIKTANADNPLTLDLKPLFTIDVWEHAYYLDYQNRRADFIEACFKIINWHFAEKNLTR